MVFNILIKVCIDTDGVNKKLDFLISIQIRIY